MRGSLPWVMGAGCPSPPALSFGGVQGAFLPYLVGVLKHGRGNSEQMQETHTCCQRRGTQRVLPLTHHQKDLVSYPGLRGSLMPNSLKQVLWRHGFHFTLLHTAKGPWFGSCQVSETAAGNGDLMVPVVSCTSRHRFCIIHHQPRCVPAPCEQGPAARSW